MDLRGPRDQNLRAQRAMDCYRMPRPQRSQERSTGATLSEIYAYTCWLILSFRPGSMTLKTFSLLRECEMDPDWSCERHAKELSRSCKKETVCRPSRFAIRRKETDRPATELTDSGLKLSL